MSTMSVEEKTPTADISSKEGCLFCSFAHGGERKTELLYEVRRQFLSLGFYFSKISFISVKIF